MKEALNALTIQEKLYQIERIHGKIVTYYNTYDDQQVIMMLNSFKELIECFNLSKTSKEYIAYLQSISQVIYLVKNNYNFFASLGFMHGSYIRFRNKFSNTIVNACEIEYQKFGLILLEIEGIFKRSFKYPE